MLKNRLIKILFGSLLFISGLLMLNFQKSSYYNNNEEIITNQIVEANMEEREIINEITKIENQINIDDYIATITIPKINLHKKLFSKNSINNDVNKNIKVLKESSMPDENNSNLILASHSGSSAAAYFNNLKELEINDIVLITYKNICYEYKVYKIVEVDKDGEIIISRNNSDNYLTLITCKIGTNKQIVVICKLVN